MTQQIFVSLILFSSQALAQELPKKFNIQEIAFKSIAPGKRLTLKGDFQIPQGFKHNSVVSMDVYEKEGGTWVKRQTIREKDQPQWRMSNKVRFEKVIETRSKDSDVAVDLSVAFCKKICVINNFQGIAKRMAQSRLARLDFSLKGLLPSQMIKKEFIKK